MLAPDFYQTGTQYPTASGRMTTPCPRIDLSSDRKAQNSQVRVRQWLATNASEEAMLRDDDFNLTPLRAMNGNTMSMADVELAAMYLWDTELHRITTNQPRLGTNLSSISAC